MSDKTLFAHECAMLARYLRERNETLAASGICQKHAKLILSTAISQWANTLAKELYDETHNQEVRSEAEEKAAQAKANSTGQAATEADQTPISSDDNAAPDETDVRQDEDDFEEPASVSND